VGSAAYGQALDRALADGAFTYWDKHIPGIFAAGEDYGFINAGHLFGVVGLDSRDLTRGMLLGRKQAQEFLRFYRGSVPGCERMVHVGTAPMLGLRETRRIVGEYTLTGDDFLACRTFPDDVGRHNYPVDIHIMSPDQQGFETYHTMFTRSYRLARGQSFGIPYRALVPRGSANLLVAGRCISCDRIAQGSIRVMPGCFITGHAAGAAAALCCADGTPPASLDAELLRGTLRQQGAYIP
jgi:hypothetical protein